MIPVFQSLEQIRTGFSMFEKDQVLTHDQLNTVATYADDQNRLTRIALTGVGIGCGLRVSLAGTVVTVSRGVGVTTDGDILSLDEETRYTRFRRYGDAFPAYPPFFADRDVSSTMIDVFELIAEGSEAEGAEDLAGFAAAAGVSLGETTAVLFMESYRKDDDLCTGTDCDNLGIEVLNTQRLLLVRRTVAGTLGVTQAVHADAFTALAEAIAVRPIITPGLAAYSGLATIYRDACTTMHGRLDTALRALYPALSPFIGGVIASDPAPGWMTRLGQLQQSFAAGGAGIQYYYDFLKDLVESYNELRDALFDDTTWCLPDPAAFPKHLLLGDLASSASPDANRTRLYPSPFTSRTSDAGARALFLLRRIDAMIRLFRLDASTSTPVRITPSRFEDVPLEDRAIPFYYPPNGSETILRSWSYRRARRSPQSSITSYHAAAFGATGAAANPLASPIGQYPFFRIEGHLGKSVSAALAAIEAEINQRNLPIRVETVMLGSDRRVVVKRPGRRKTDLDRFHYMIRHDLRERLEEAERFSSTFRKQIDTAVEKGIVSDSAPDNDGVPVREVAEQKDNAVRSGSSTARAKLGGSYESYRRNASWQEDVGSTIRSAGEFKSNLGPVVKTEFTSAFDALITLPHYEWLPWLDILIDDREDRDSEHLLFRTFAAEHRGLEHYGGVLRGGTFVLVYDASNVVVADFMLPYAIEVEEREEEADPPLPKPKVRPEWIIDNPIKVAPSRNTYVRREFERMRADFEPKVLERINYQERYIAAVKDTFEILKGTFEPVRTGKTIGEFNDALLGGYVRENQSLRERVEAMRDIATNPATDPAERKRLEEQIVVVEAELARSTSTVAGQLAKSGADATAGSDAERAVEVLAKSVEAVKSPQTIASLEKELGRIAKEITAPALKGRIDRLAKRR